MEREETKTLQGGSSADWHGGVIDSFRRCFGVPPQVVTQAPGRVNLLGAHVDTHEGWVLPGAIDRSVWLAAAKRRDRRLSLRALNLDETAEIALDALPPPRVERPAIEESAWADLVAGVAWALERSETGPARGELPGMDVVFGGDLPIGAGVSSSAAVEMAFLLAWEALGRFVLDDDCRARVGRQAENGYLGVASGIMDQLASLAGERDGVLLIDCRSLERKSLSLPPGLAVLMADSGVRRSLADSAYNTRQRECAEALERLRLRLPDLRTLRDLTLEDLDRQRDCLEPHLERRARHVVTECGRVLAAARAVEAGDVKTLGELMCGSHQSSRDLFEVSTPELDLLAEAAWSQPGCHGARLSGGGFGGFVSALVDEERLAAVRQAMAAGFADAFERPTSFFSCRFADGARVVWRHEEIGR